MPDGDETAADEGRPSFGEVIKAFTPPGTNFEEFKAALHSQGAPGMISPEMVAILNQGGIMPEVIAQTGATCARCDHPHGGPPGPACLEAERHLGRSPLRRSPDLQLDAIDAERRQRSLRPPGTTEQALRDADAMPLSPELTERMRNLAKGSPANFCPDPARPGHGTGCMCAAWYLQRAEAARAAEMPPDPRPMSQGAMAAVAMHEAFLDLMAGGFTEDQALTILARAFAARNGSADG
jgi:hypothetical protein